MSKTKEELNTLKQEYQTLNYKLKELTDDELKTVVGGTVSEMGCSSVLKGHWYTTTIHPDHVLKALNNSEIQLWSSGNNFTFLGVNFARYWYDGVNAWNHGTCSSVGSEEYVEVNAPTNIYIKFTTEKPF